MLSQWQAYAADLNYQQTKNAFSRPTY